MSEAGDLRRVSLGLPEAYEDLHRRRPAFRVRKKIFAMLGAAGNTSLFVGLGEDDIAVVKLDRDDQLNLIAAHGEALSATEAYSHHGWTYLRLANADEALMTLVLQLAWTHVAPKALSKAFCD